MKGKNTEGAVGGFVEQIYNSFNKNYKATGFIIDFCKAFDLVNHEILLYKLERAEIRGTSLKWFETYLKNRKLEYQIP